MKTERKYYLVAPESPVMEKINKANANYKIFCMALELFKNEHGATNAYHNQRHFCGLKFEGEPPVGWRPKAGQDFCVPNLKTKEGRAIKKLVEALPPGFDQWSFSDGLGEGYTYYGSGFVSWASFDKYGENVILSVAVEAKVEPAGCTELKMSEYWRIVEEAKEKAA